MSEGPFRLGTTNVGIPCVTNTKGDIVHVCITEHDARRALDECLRVWKHGDGPSLQSRLAEAEELLRELEWCASSPEYRSDDCPVCGSFKRIGSLGGHSTDCRLAKFLKGGG